MAIDKEKYIAKYIDEGLENITMVEGLVFDIKEGISIEDDLATLLRALHTLKGLSRMLEFKRIEELTHALESVFISFREQRVSLSENAIKLILCALDLLKEGIVQVQRTKNDDIEIEEYKKNLDALAANDDFFLPLPSKEQETSVKKKEIKPKKTITPEEKVSQSVSEKASASRPAEGSQVKKSQSKSESIRLSIEKIDGIIKSIASLQSLEIEAKAISVDSAELSSLICEYSAKLKAEKTKDMGVISHIRKLERLSMRINSALKNYSADASNQIRSAYDTVISLRTIPLSSILDTYPRYVFQLSSELGKKVQFTIEGKENEIDKNIIETLSDVIMHMVRNSIDHGIETSEDRLAAGKNESGKLSIVCSRESGSMKIVITDDGRGLDIEKIRERVVREGFVTEAAALALTKEELTNYIFQSGFSTSVKVDNVSGRGVGMDVVRDSIEAMKGSVVVDSIQGSGTSFTIMVPLSIAALMGFPVISGGIKFIIPSAFVDTIQMLSSDDIMTVVDRPEIKYNNRLIKLFYLNQVLQIKTDSAGLTSLSDSIFVVIIRAYDDFLALAVDDIASMRSVILKNMPDFMEGMSVFSGIVLNEDYEMVSVLHIPTIIKMAKRIKTIDIKKRNMEFEKLRKTILVVDDSRPTRDIMHDILSSEGYIVDTASDGAQALKAAKAKQYDVICTDINMPVMDGFMLTENIKKNEELSNIPIIVISSLSSEEDQKRAALLGASRYIVKNSFNNHNLLEAVRELTGAANEQ